MVDVVLSYKREELPLATELAAVLKRRGWSVWWDAALKPGDRFDDVIEAAIRSAGCTVVLWTRLSVKSDYVRDEALLARSLNKLVPVQFGAVEPPFRFQSLHTIRLSHWGRLEGSPGAQALVLALTRRIGAGRHRAARPAPVQPPASPAPVAVPQAPTEVRPSPVSPPPGPAPAAAAPGPGPGPGLGGWATRCDACGTCFRIQPAQLAASAGWVRCGRCSAVFDARARLFDPDVGPRPRDAGPDLDLDLDLSGLDAPAGGASR